VVVSSLLEWRLAMRAAALAVLVSLCLPAMAQPEIVAVVNGQPITKDTLVDRLLVKSTVGQQVLETMIVELVLEQEAKKKGIEVKQEEIAQRIERVKKELGTAEAFNEYLLRQDVTETGLPGRLRVKIMVEKLLGGRVQVSDDEIRRFYDRNRDILFTQPATATIRLLAVKTEEAARAARNRAVKGEDFGALVRELSIHEASRSLDGRIGPSTSQGLDMIYRGLGGVAFATDISEITQPTKLDDLYVLVKVEAKTQGRVFAFEEVKDKIQSSLRESHLTEVYVQWAGEVIRDPSMRIERRLGQPAASP
jgi:foldase protein PrsA